jgi:hypothetical protein
MIAIATVKIAHKKHTNVPAPIILPTQASRLWENNPSAPANQQIATKSMMIPRAVSRCGLGGDGETAEWQPLIAIMVIKIAPEARIRFIMLIARAVAFLKLKSKMTTKIIGTTTAGINTNPPAIEWAVSFEIMPL